MLAAIIFKNKISLNQMHWDVVGSRMSSLQIKACFYLAARDKYGPDTWDVSDWTTTCLALLQVAFDQQQPNNLCFTALKAANPVTQCILCMCMYVYLTLCVCVRASETERKRGNVCWQRVTVLPACSLYLCHKQHQTTCKCVFVFLGSRD